MEISGIVPKAFSWHGGLDSAKSGFFLGDAEVRGVVQSFSCCRSFLNHTFDLLLLFSFDS